MGRGVREERGDSIARQHLFTNKTYLIHWIMLFQTEERCAE
jgi:hypothetical protein